MEVGGSKGSAERRLENELFRDLELLKWILIRSGITKTMLRKNEGVFFREEPVPDKRLFPDPGRGLFLVLRADYSIDGVQVRLLRGAWRAKTDRCHDIQFGKSAVN